MFEFDFFSRKSLFVFHLMRDEKGFLLELKNNIGQLDIISIPFDERGHTLHSKFVFHQKNILGYVYEFSFYDNEAEEKKKDIEKIISESTEVMWQSYSCICSIAYLNEWLAFDRGISSEYCYGIKTASNKKIHFALTKEERTTTIWEDQVSELNQLIASKIEMK